MSLPRKLTCGHPIEGSEPFVTSPPSRRSWICGVCDEIKRGTRSAVVISERTDLRDGREFKVTVLADAGREIMETKKRQRPLYAASANTSLENERPDGP